MARLKTLLEIAYREVPYYRDLFQYSGLTPEKICARNELARLPVTTKAALRAGSPARVVRQGVARRAIPRCTSGSTGEPFAFSADRAGRDAWLGSYLLLRGWAGAPLGTSKLVITSEPHAIASVASSSRVTRLLRQAMFGERAIQRSGVMFSADELDDLVAQMLSRTPYMIWSFPSYLNRLADGLLKSGRALAQYPRVVVSYGETLTDAVRERISVAFRCRVVNHFSSWEVLHLAQTCPDNDSVMHVVGDRTITRVVDANGEDVLPGEVGRLVVTDLTNLVMPLINYDHGDRAVQGEPCRCGRGFATLASIDGRQSEVIKTADGRMVSPVTLGRHITFVCGALPYLTEYQAIQRALGQVTLRVVPTDRFDPPFRERLERGLEELLGPTVAVAIECVPRIEFEASGKRLIIKTTVEE
jgi:phenylacetate-CoA ligase